MLPIETILPEVIESLRSTPRLVLQAPPGAGKTTRVPLALMQAGLCKGKIVMLEPRRLAARAAATRMAETLGQSPGQTVGYRMRGETKTSKDTLIEVVTEGILTRMLQTDPELPGIGAIIFDEFHERSLNADLGLALCLESAEALRDDLIIIAMSATLDAQPVADVMEAPVLTAEGRSFPVTSVWADAPVGKTRFETAMANRILEGLRHPGSLLAFLPGEGEIRRTAQALDGKLPGNCDLETLYGAMPFAAQKKAIAPAETGRRKVVLSTAIAETSLTLPDIRIVVDGGRARRALFDPSSGMSRLVTERVTRAEATQRAGRAGRVADGVCLKLWTKGEDGSFAAFPPPEISAGDLASFALELALWGTGPEDLRFVTPPHEGRLAEAQALLKMLGALNEDGRITEHGRQIAGQPLHPRLAHMLLTAGKQAAPMAALLSERDLLRGRGVDLTLRLRALKDPAAFGLPRDATARIDKEAKRLARGLPAARPMRPAEYCALAYPDRVGLRRTGEAPRYLLSGGKGAVLPDGDALAGTRLIVVTDLDGDAREARVRQAIPMTESELRALFADEIDWQDICEWSKRDGCVRTVKQERFGALVLEERRWSETPEEAVSRAMLEGVRQLGLRPSAAAKRFLSRCALMGLDFPNFAEAHLMATMEDWLLPHLSGVRNNADWTRFDLLPALKGRLSWAENQMLDQAAPSHFETPLGRRVPIDYASEQPAIAVRLQEMFGVTRHPKIGLKPLQVTLLSPAQRPVQVTTDLPGFWASSYADVRKDMRGQYPKHPWPEDPTQADPTLRAKRRSKS